MINFSPRVWKNAREAWEMQDILFKERCLFLNTAVEEDSVLALCQQMMVLDQDNSGVPIKLHLMSPGGAVNHALALVDVMQTIKSPVETTVMGIAASAAALLTAAGAKGKRRAMFNARIMIHEIAGGMQGKISVQRDELKEMEVLDNILNDLLSKFTGRTRAEIETALRRKDCYMSPQEAKEFGLIDEVVSWTKTW